MKKVILMLCMLLLSSCSTVDKKIDSRFKDMVNASKIDVNTIYKYEDEGVDVLVVFASDVSDELSLDEDVYTVDVEGKNVNTEEGEVLLSKIDQEEIENILKGYYEIAEEDDEIATKLNNIENTNIYLLQFTIFPDEFKEKMELNKITLKYDNTPIFSKEVDNFKARHVDSSMPKSIEIIGMSRVSDHGIATSDARLTIECKNDINLSNFRDENEDSSFWGEITDKKSGKTKFNINSNKKNKKFTCKKGDEITIYFSKDFEFKDGVYAHTAFDLPVYSFTIDYPKKQKIYVTNKVKLDPSLSIFNYINEE